MVDALGVIIGQFRNVASRNSLISFVDLIEKNFVCWTEVIPSVTGESYPVGSCIFKPIEVWWFVGCSETNDLDRYTDRQSSLSTTYPHAALRRVQDDWEQTGIENWAWDVQFLDWNSARSDWLDSYRHDISLVCPVCHTWNRISRVDPGWLMSRYCHDIDWMRQVEICRNFYRLSQW